MLESYLNGDASILPSRGLLKTGLRVWLNKGIRLAYGDARIILDPYGLSPGCEVALLTHAHRDHSQGYVNYRRRFATEETLDLLALYVSRKRLRGSRKVSVGRRLSLNGLKISIHDSGHILGSVMYLISTSEGTLLYTGDLNLVETLISKPAEEPPCDTLIIDSTFGYPYFRFPPRSELYNRIVSWTINSIKSGVIPVLRADSIGNSQELITLFNRFTEIPVVVHPRVAIVSDVYRRHGFKMEYFSVNSAEGLELVRSGFCVYIAPKGSRVSLGRPTREALVSGWALRFGGFPLSDHADYPMLLEYVSRVKPKVVYTYPGGYSGRVLAERIRKTLSIEAKPLSFLKPL